MADKILAINPPLSSLYIELEDLKVYCELYIRLEISLNYHANIISISIFADTLFDDLEKSPEYIQLSSKIEDISERISVTASKDNQRNSLLNHELDNWQKRQILECQPIANIENDDHSTSSYRGSFDRISHLILERKRLSKLLLMPVPLRSPEGRQILLRREKYKGYLYYPGIILIALVTGR
ncbi:hypothetical protein TESG_08434 [Trichophyton tonsurans CBS 112818]|uniref:Uncharacterized protein n=1 Tax=Trichophyton tonsurans (strain CBS 112818) TaxID=647933 RepID=F2RYC5_TRIT1|nr:hypothetical protein TESG_08434 [Trichophyton tonsurans CBS 112818]